MEWLFLSANAYIKNREVIEWILSVRSDII